MKRKLVKDEDIVRRYVDVDTGEITHELREGDTIRVDTKERKDYRLNHRIIKEREGFIKLFLDSLNILSKEDFTSSETKIIFTALQYIDYNSGILIEDKINISKGRFIELVGVSENTFDKSMKRLIDSEILAKTISGRNNVYLVNPFIFMRGKDINNTLYKIFKNSKWNTYGD